MAGRRKPVEDIFLPPPEPDSAELCRTSDPADPLFTCRIPPSASPALLVDLCLSWMDSGRTLAGFCALANAPAYSRMKRILASTPEFLERYTAAKRELADRLWDDAVRIADTVPDVNRAKLMIDVRLKLAARLAPEAKGKSDLVVSVRRFGQEGE